MRYKKYTQIIPKLKLLYSEGQSTTQLSCYFGISQATISKILRDNGVNMRMKGLAITPIKNQELHERNNEIILLSQIYNRKELSDKYGISIEMVRIIQKKSGANYLSMTGEIKNIISYYKDESL